MLKFDLAVICRGKLHCTLCRTKDGSGSRFRTEIAGQLTEQVAVDFDCPSGYAWDVKIEPEYVPPKPVFPNNDQQSAQLSKNAELVKQRFEICKTCEHATENGHKCALHKGCCFGGWRARPESQCYADPSKWLKEGATPK